jgi:hypothetical protein
LWKKGKGRRMSKLEDALIMKKIEEDRKICEDAGHKKWYDTEAEYRGQVGYEREVLKVMFQAFLENTSTTNYLALERSMLLYQNILSNCTWKRGDDE